MNYDTLHVMSCFFFVFVAYCAPYQWRRMLHVASFQFQSESLPELQLIFHDLLGCAFLVIQNMIYSDRDCSSTTIRFELPVDVFISIRPPMKSVVR
jgi:hypothetical protein